MSEQKFSIALSKVVEEFQFEKLYESKNYDDILITRSEVNRPALQIIGFFDYFDNKRIQILGKVELTYLEQFGYEKGISF